MSVFRHRVMLDCDLAFDVEADSPDTSLDELENRATQILRQASGDEACCLADLGFDASQLPGGRFYPRVEHPTPTAPCQMDADDRLENLTAENCDELTP